MGQRHGHERPQYPVLPNNVTIPVDTARPLHYLTRLCLLFRRHLIICHRVVIGGGGGKCEISVAMYLIILKGKLPCLVSVYLALSENIYMLPT